MSIIQFDKKFIKQYDRASEQIRKSFDGRLELLIANRNNPILHTHRLHSPYSDCWSINITGDWRAVFNELYGGDVIFFIAIGTHSQLYK